MTIIRGLSKILEEQQSWRDLPAFTYQIKFAEKYGLKKALVRGVTVKEAQKIIYRFIYRGGWRYTATIRKLQDELMELLNQERGMQNAR